MESGNKIEHVRIQGAKNSSIVIKVPSYTTPGFMRQMNGGCSTSDRNTVDNHQIDTAMSISLIQLLTENIIGILSKKLILTSIHSFIQYGHLIISITIPDKLTFINYTLREIRKIFGTPLLDRTSRIYCIVQPEAKRNKKVIHDTVARNLNGNISIYVYTGSDATQRFKVGIVKYIPSNITHSNNYMQQASPSLQVSNVYRPMQDFNTYSNTSKALLISTLQLANYDFFVDSEYNNIYLHKQHADHTTPIRKFMTSKSKQLPTDNKKYLVAFLSILYIYSANTLPVSIKDLSDPNIAKDIQKMIQMLPQSFIKRRQQ